MHQNSVDKSTMELEPRSVDMALGMLEKTVHLAGKTVDELHQRIESVLGPQRPVDTIPQRNTLNCPMADRINEMDSHLYIAVTTLREIISRIEL